MIDGLLESAWRQFRDREVPTPTGKTEGTPLPREDDIEVSGAPYGDVVGSTEDNGLPEDNSGSTLPGASEPVRDEPCHTPNASLMQSLSLGGNTNDSRYRKSLGGTSTRVSTHLQNRKRREEKHKSNQFKLRGREHFGPGSK